MLNENHKFINICPSEESYFIIQNIVQSYFLGKFNNTEMFLNLFLRERKCN